MELVLNSPSARRLRPFARQESTAAGDTEKKVSKTIISVLMPVQFTTQCSDAAAVFVDKLSRDRLLHDLLYLKYGMQCQRQKREKGFQCV